MRRRNSWIKQPAGGLLVCCELKGFKRNSRRTKTTIESAHTHKQCTGTVLLKPERQTGCSSIGYLCSTYFILYYSIIVSFLVFCMKRFGSKTPPVDIWLSASGCRQMFTRFLYLFIYNFFFRFFHFVSALFHTVCCGSVSKIYALFLSRCPHVRCTQTYFFLVFIASTNAVCCVLSMCMCRVPQDGDRWGRPTKNDTWALGGRSAAATPSIDNTADHGDSNGGRHQIERQDNK